MGNPYPLRWEHLQMGFSVEHDVRRLVAKLSVKLSKERGFRVNAYTPLLDLDGVDLILRIEGERTTYIEVSVKSSSYPVIRLGREEKYGTLARWQRRCRLHVVPSLLFFFDWNKGRLSFLTPALVKKLSDGGRLSSFKYESRQDDVEDAFYGLLSSIAEAKNLTEVVALLS